MASDTRAAERRKQRAAAKSKGTNGTAPAAIPEVIDDGPPGSVAVNGVMIQCVPGQNPGDIQIHVTAIGDTRETEVLTILEYALRVTRQKIGIV